MLWIIFFSGSKFNVTSIHIHNATIENFDLKLEECTKLESLSVINGKISKFQGRFSNNNLTSMNLSGNGIIDIGPETFKKLSGLRILDVSRNNLTKISDLIPNRKKEFILDISRNKFINHQLLIFVLFIMFFNLMVNS